MDLKDQFAIKIQVKSCLRSCVEKECSKLMEISVDTKSAD